MRLVEPLGLIDGPAATECVAAGLALPLAGGPIAFTLARLIDMATPGPAPVVPVAAIAESFQAALARVIQAPPPWAGLPTARPLVMGIINVTPDSFSDGGAHLDPELAIASARAMVAAGADLIDVGGESTRPGSAGTPSDVEQARILPVIRALAAAGIIVSVDTRKAATMAAALGAGARIVNDVSALQHDPRAASVVAAHGCPVILMHMRGEPDTMMGLTAYNDVAVDVVSELADRLAEAEAAGISRDRIAVDPGLGFAKHSDQSGDVLRRSGLLLNLGCPVVIGVSRKRLIGQLSGEEERRRRAPGSIVAGLHAAARGGAILRVHDVAETVQAVRVWRGLTGSA